MNLFGLTVFENKNIQDVIIQSPANYNITEIVSRNNNGSYDINASGTDSGFTRKIQINQLNTDEMKASSIVSWTQGSGSYSITFSEDLFNWIQ